MKFTRFFTFFTFLFFFIFFAQANNVFFPKQQLSFGFYSKSIIGANPWRPPSPIFWDSETEANSGGTILYTRILYHTQKYFSVSWGVSGSVWHYKFSGNKTIGALSALIQLRWWIFRTSWFNPYLVYSVAGPTLLTNHRFGTANFSANFLWQDYLGFGILFGKNHHFDLSARMYHYSNGDMFVHNDGFDVPLVIFLGFTF